MLGCKQLSAYRSQIIENITDKADGVCLQSVHGVQGKKKVQVKYPQFLVSCQ